ncbi:MAG: methyltransferase [Opitutales bacterium]|nr:methyltransferase [Opitutales bacterium]
MIITVDKSVFEHANIQLRNWYGLHRSAFYDVLQTGKTIRAEELEGVELEPLSEIGLLDDSSSLVSTNKSITKFRDLFIVSDRPDDQNLNRVFPPFQDESILLAESATRKKSHRFLDVGTGSGIVALAAAKYSADHVVATDITLESKEEFEFNARLNGLENKCEFILSDVYEHLSNKEKFDAISCNPPFVPLPKSFDYFVHSHGGSDGLEVYFRLVKRLPEFLSEDGELHMVMLSLLKNNRPIIENSLMNLPESFVFSIDQVYEVGDVDILGFYDWLPKTVPCLEWLKSLLNNGYSRIGYFSLVVSGRPSITTKLSDVKDESWPELSNSFKNRSKRYIRCDS